jgi:hypothetical protein
VETFGVFDMGVVEFGSLLLSFCARIYFYLLYIFNHPAREGCGVDLGSTLSLLSV